MKKGEYDEVMMIITQHKTLCEYVWWRVEMNHVLCYHEWYSGNVVMKNVDESRTMLSRMILRECSDVETNKDVGFGKMLWKCNGTMIEYQYQLTQSCTELRSIEYDSRKMTRIDDDMHDTIYAQCSINSVRARAAMS